MTTELTTYTADDGWDEAAAETSGRAIQGTLLKFNDWKWTPGKEALPLPEGTRLVAVKTAAAFVRWEDKRPVEYIWREKGKPLPDREALSMWDDRSEWEIGLSGDKEDPWRDTRYVYLIDPTTMTAYTFSTHSTGGRNAVRDLGDNIARVRKMRSNPNSCRWWNCRPKSCRRSTARNRSRCSESSNGVVALRLRKRRRSLRMPSASIPWMT